MTRLRHPACVCGAAKVDGRCQAMPSCSDFQSPAALQVARNRSAIRIRAQAVREAEMNVADRAALRVSLVLSGVIPQSLADSRSQRVRRGWRTRRRDA